MADSLKMSTGTVQSSGARPANAGQADGSSWKSTARSILQMVGIYLAIQYAMKQFMPRTADQKSTADVPAYVPSRQSASSQSAYPQTIVPMWPASLDLDIAVYISSSVVMPALTSMPQDSLVLHEQAFRYGDSAAKRDSQRTFRVPKSVQDNGTLWAHIYVAQSGAPLDPTDPTYDSTKAYRMSRPLNQYLARKKARKTRSLLNGNQTEAETVQAPVIASYYHPNLTLAFVRDSGSQSFAQMQPAIRQYVQLDQTGARDETGQIGWYYPIVFINTFWQLRSHMIELNDTVKELPINIHLKNEPHWIFSILAGVDENVKETARRAARGESLPGGGDGSEFEMIKEVILDSNIYLLGTTAVVTVLHMIFELLAFSSDVSHWRKKKDNVGTSVRTILANVIMQSIILLYLLDNNENTSYMILAGQGVGIAIEAWKITKTVHVRIRPAPKGALVPYRVTFEDKHKLSDVEKKTQEYDEIAFQYLYIAIVPLLIGYAVYSLIYETHKSWYSFTITSLVGFVYAFGFAMMIPSLYINYRLQSVAHLPAKAMTYKFLNTIVDDFFAFTIKMPVLHRLACFRDDVVFVVYLWQAWKYRVDHTRVNEFGQGGEEEDLVAKLADNPLSAVPDAKIDVPATSVENSSAHTATGSAGLASSRKRK